MSWTPFFLKRIGPAGADTHKHLFCAGAKGNPELVRQGETDAEVLIDGAWSSDGGKSSRHAVQRMVDALNAVWEQYLAGGFHKGALSGSMLRVLVRQYQLNDLPFVMGALKEAGLAQNFDHHSHAAVGDWVQCRDADEMLTTVRHIQQEFPGTLISVEVS